MEVPIYSLTTRGLQSRVLGAFWLSACNPDRLGEEPVRQHLLKLF